MMKQLVGVGVSLLLCLSADGVSAAPARKSASPTDCTTAANKNIPPCAPETGKVTIFWPKGGMSDKVARSFNSKIEVWIDKAKVGMVLGDVPLTVSVPNGPHKLELKVNDDYLENIRPVRETEITVSAQKPLYFQIVNSGFVITPRELDAPTAQAVLSKSNAYLAGLGGNDGKPPSGDGTIYVYWPKPGLGIGFLETLATDLPVKLDGKRVGAVKLGQHLTLKAPPGEHTLEVEPGSSPGGRNREGFVLGAGGTRYFRIENQDAVRMFEDSPEEAAAYGKGTGFTVAASELTPPAAPIVLPVNEPSAATPQATVAAVSGTEPKGKPNASPFLTASVAAPAGNDTRAPSGVGTIYIYWPKPGLGFAFLDGLATDLPVFLDGKRIGAVKLGEYLALKTSPGEHAVGLDAGLPNGRLLKKDFILGAGSTAHFHIENQDAVRLFEDSPEEAVDNAKGLRQREVSVQ